MRNLKKNRQKGITLIALVVTIVVLIILATVSVNAVLGNNGIINRAQKARDSYSNSQKSEDEQMAVLANEMAQYNEGNSSEDGKVTLPDGWNGDKVNPVKSDDNVVVPVPKGYVASTVEGEKSVSSGFVIKEGNDGAATEGINEFVWVPVSNISDIYDEVNNAGQLWNFSGTTSSKRIYPTQLQTEFKEMIKSVKTYGGFYIGRYETGNLSQTKAVVQKNNSDIADQTWYTMYKMCKTIKANDNVYTGMIWGCQWDATMRWMQTSTNTEVANFPTNSAGKGNYDGTQGSTNAPIPTGSNSSYSVNNIYDMAGNVLDRTIEAIYTNARVIRGGNYNNTASNIPASIRFNSLPTASSSDYGCRSTLYIK